MQAVAECTVCLAACMNIIHEQGRLLQLYECAGVRDFTLGVMRNEGSAQRVIVVTN